MELRSEHLAVLNVFHKHCVGRSQFLPVQVLRREWEYFLPEIQKNLDTIIRILADSGFILCDPLGYGLTEKGGHYIQRSFSQSYGDRPTGIPGAA